MGFSIDSKNFRAFLFWVNFYRLRNMDTMSLYFADQNDKKINILKMCLTAKLMAYKATGVPYRSYLKDLIVVVWCELFLQNDNTSPNQTYVASFRGYGLFNT